MTIDVPISEQPACALYEIVSSSLWLEYHLERE